MDLAQRDPIYMKPSEHLLEPDSALVVTPRDTRVTVPCRLRLDPSAALRECGETLLRSAPFEPIPVGVKVCVHFLPWRDTLTRLPIAPDRRTA